MLTNVDIGPIWARDLISHLSESMMGAAAVTASVGRLGKVWGLHEEETVLGEDLLESLPIFASGSGFMYLRFWPHGHGEEVRDPDLSQILKVW